VNLIEVKKCKTQSIPIVSRVIPAVELGFGIIKETHNEDGFCIGKACGRGLY
jgi:hypothetical protein